MKKQKNSKGAKKATQVKGLPTIVMVQWGRGIKGSSVRGIDASTKEDITNTITYATLKNAYANSMWLSNASGKWRQVEPQTPRAAAAPVQMSAADVNMMNWLGSCIDKRPSSLYCEDLTWKFICRSVIRGRNVLLTGPTGCGKSQTAFADRKSVV